MGKKANERRKRIVQEVLGSEHYLAKKPKPKPKPKPEPISRCCLDKYASLPTTFRKCIDCPKEES